MDAIWQELIRAVPWGAVIVILRWLDIKDQAEQRKDREANAKEKAERDRETSIVVAQTYASAINNMVKVTEMSINSLVSSVNEFKETVLEQYRKMGATQEIIDLAVDRAMEKMREGKKE